MIVNTRRGVRTWCLENVGFQLIDKSPDSYPYEARVISHKWAQNEIDKFCLTVWSP